MQSTKELRSLEKLMSESKKIVDGGTDILSNFYSYAENVSVTDEFSSKVEDRPQETRPGLGIALKKASFSLKTRISYLSLNFEPTLDIDHLEDPDLFFDAYERNENAKKEIQKQLGGNKDNIDLCKPSNKERCRRPGILGSSQETTVYQDIPSPPKDESQENLMIPDPNIDADLEEVELAESMKKAESQVNDMLEELLSCNYEDLEGEGALNPLQEWLKIKPLDMENLCCLTELPDVGTNILTSLGSRKKPRKSSVVLDSVLKNLNKKPHVEQELVENQVDPVSSPTSLRCPFGSLSLLKKKIFQPNPLRDSFSPEDIDLCAHPNSSSAQPKDKLIGQVAAPKNLGMCNELESHVEFGYTEPALSDMDSQEVMGKADKMPEQSTSENASMQRESGSSRANDSPSRPKDKLVGQVDALKDLGIFIEMESNVEFDSTTPPFCNLETRKVIVNADGLPEQFEDENAHMPSMDAITTQNEESDNIGNVMNTDGNESNPFLVDEEVRGDTSTRRKINPEQQPEVHAAKRQRGERATGVRITDAHPMRKSLAEAGTSFETAVRRSKRVKMRPMEYWKGERFLYGHVDNKAGTSFENGVRKSTRVKMRPLEYWKGERFLYGHVDNSLKLIGVKCFSPGKGDENLKVMSYVSLEKPEYKEVLDLAARH